MSDIEWFEGRPTSFDKRLASYTWDNAPEAYKAALGNFDREIFEAIQETQRHSVSEDNWGWIARNIYINCWHQGQSESHAMWRVYVTGNEGICVRSTFKRLKECISGSDKHIHIGMVKYIDEDIIFTPRGNIFYPFLQKRSFFEYEKELRAGIFHVEKGEFPIGISIPVDLKVLIEDVLIHPEAPRWLKCTVEGIVEKFGYKFDVSSSAIRSPAVP